MEEENIKKKMPRHVRMPHKMDEGGKLEFQVKGLYMILKDFMNGETKQCWPSLQTLSEASELSIPTIRKYLKILEERGHIKISKKKVTRTGADAKDVKRAPNVYTFNEDSELYKNGFEMFTHDFLTKKIKFREKAACIALQEHMFKDGETGVISSTNIELCDILGVSYNTFKSIKQNLLREKILTTTSSNAKDSVTGELKTQYFFDLDILGQAILYNQNKIKEHDQKFEEHDQRFKEFEKRIAELEKENRELRKRDKLLLKEVNEKEIKELNSNLKLEVC